MMIILEKDELAWIETVRRGFTGLRAMHNLYERGKIDKDRLIVALGKDLSEVEIAIDKLKARGI